MLSVFFAFFLSIVTLFIPFGGAIAFASQLQRGEFLIPTTPTVVENAVGRFEGRIFDFSQVTISTLPEVEVTTELIHNLEHVSAADFSELRANLGGMVGAQKWMTVGMLGYEALGLDLYSLNDIAQRTGADLAATYLGEYGDFIGDLTPDGLTNAIEGFGKLNVKDVPSILAMTNLLPGEGVQTFNMLSALQSGDHGLISEQLEGLGIVPGGASALANSLQSGNYGAIAGELEGLGIIPGGSVSLISSLQPGNSFDAAMKIADFVGATPMRMDQIQAGIQAALNGDVGAALGAIANYYGIPDKFDVENLPIAAAMQIIPGLADTPLEILPQNVLDVLPLDSIPGLADKALGEVPSSGDALLDDLQATGLLDKLTFSDYPNPPRLVPWAKIGLLDVPFEGEEQQRLRVISGGVPAPGGLQSDECPGTTCPHVEVRDMTDGAFNGQAWMTGQQKVPDGFGYMCTPFGCVGPAGNHPFGAGFRFLWIKTDEASGVAIAGMSFRACSAFPTYSCSPYVFPSLTGIPVAAIPEGTLVPFAPPGGAKLGGVDWSYPACQSAGITPRQFVDISQALDATNMSESYKKMARRLVASVPSGLTQNAADSIPRILAAAEQAGISDKAQIAYMMATTQRETQFGVFMEEIWDNNPTQQSYENRYDDLGNHQSGDGYRYRGRGYVQITGRRNYTLYSDLTGKDIINNPDLVAQDRDLAAQIMVHGMMTGGFTGVGMSRYINESTGAIDFYNARRTVNGTDHASEIAANAERYYAAIKDLDLTADPVAVSAAPTPSNSLYALGDPEESTGENGGSEGEELDLSDFQGEAPDPDAVNEMCALAGLSPSGAGTPMHGGGSPIFGAAPPPGEINLRIMETIRRLGGFSTRHIPGTNNGRVACAGAVNFVLHNAGLKVLGGTGSYGGLHVTLHAEPDLRAGRGVQVNPSEAQPGDIVLVDGGGNRQHIGFCLDVGCRTQISNSSRNAAFTWTSNGWPAFTPSYSTSARNAVYRLLNMIVPLTFLEE